MEANGLWRSTGSNTMNQAQEVQFEKFFEQFWDRQPEDSAYAAKDATGKWSIAAAMPALRKYAAAYIDKHNAGNASISAFEITLRLLVENGDLKPTALEPEPEVHELTVHEYRSMPVRQIQAK